VKVLTKSHTNVKIDTYLQNFTARRTVLICNDCPRKCNALRNEYEGNGFCRSGLMPVCAKAALHPWEEPCISGKRGAGNIFFSGCNLKCYYCQNSEISGIDAHIAKGKTITPQRLSEIYDELIMQGASCINLVTPTHFTDAILKSLEIHGKLNVPLVYNSGGYESTDTLKKLDGKVDIYLPDMKYGLSKPALKYSNAPDYPDIAKEAITEMFRQTGPFEINDNGQMKKGVIIRHMIIPGNLQNTFSIIDWVNETFNQGDVMFSLMSQYTPYVKTGFSELNRKLTEYEHKKAVEYMYNTNICDGFVQELSSAKEEYIPNFNLSGI